MTDRPRIICLMTSSIDGRLHPSRWTKSPDGTSTDWSRAYERIHDRIGADGWIVGRTTMAEMAKGEPLPAASSGPPPRSHHVAGTQGPFAIALDRSGRLHFAASDIGGDHVVVLLGHDVPDVHLAGLVRDGISYIVADDADMALPPLLAALTTRFGITTLLLEGGGHTNGSFLAAALVDELHVVLAPALGGGGTAIIEVGADALRDRITLSLLGCDRLEHGAIHLRYAVVPSLDGG